MLPLSQVMPDQNIIKEIQLFMLSTINLMIAKLQIYIQALLFLKQILLIMDSLRLDVITV